MKSQSYYRHFFTMLSGNSLSQVIPFLLAPVLGRIFSPEEFAVSANFMALAGMIGIVATGRLELAVPLPDGKQKAQQIVYTGLMIALGLTALSLVIPVFSETIAKWYDDPQLSGYLWMIPLAVFSFGALGLANNWSLREKRFTTISVGRVTQSVFNGGLAALLGYFGWGISGLIVGWIASQYINVIILLTGVDRKIDRRQFGLLTVKSTLKEYRDFPLINSLHAFTDIFATQVVLFWIISSCFGVPELGMFAIMHRYVRAPIIMVTSSVSQLFYVEAGKAVNENRSLVPLLRRTLVTSGLFAIPFLAVLFFFGPQLFSWYLGEKWQMAGVYAVCIMPMLLFNFILSPISVIPILFNKQRTAFALSILGYSIALGSLFAGTLLDWSFKDSLWLYSGGYTVYNLITLFWYYSISVKKR